MENQLPSILEFTGSEVTEGDFKVALNKLLLYLDEALGKNGDKAVPSGIICIWSGTADKIPSGWALCDGKNGTEDLRDRFIIGAGRNYAVNASGGNAEQAINLSGKTGETTLTIGQMPSHNHSFSAGVYNNCPGGGDTRVMTISGNMATNFAGGGQSHSHSLLGTATVSTLPPYYAKCYIQKL